MGEPKDVKIMELSELKELQKSHEPGTPEDNASILAWRGVAQTNEYYCCDLTN